MTDDTRETVTTGSNEGPELPGPAPSEQSAPQTTALDESAEKAQTWFAVFLILVVGLLAHVNAFRVPFHSHDMDMLVGNTALHSVLTFPEGAAESGLRPVAAFAVGLQWWLGLQSARAFQVVDIGIHLANAVLLFLLCRRLLGRQVLPVLGLAAGMLWAVHPITTETVNMVAGRAELLASLLVLASMHFYLMAVSSGERPGQERPGFRPVPMTCSLVALFLAWGSHGMALVTPFVLLALDWTAIGPGPRRGRIAAQAPVWALWAVLLAVSVQQGAGARLTHLLAAVATYAELTLAPVGLSVARGEALALGLDARPLLGGVLLFALLAAGTGLAAWRKLPGVALLWWVGALLAHAVFGSGEAAFSERSAYLAVAGAALLAPWLLTALPGRFPRVATGAVVGACVVAAGSGLFMRNLYWERPQELWADAAAKTPGVPGPHRELARVLLERGNVEMARAAELAQSGAVDAAGRLRASSRELFGSAAEHAKAALDLGLDDAALWTALGTARAYQGDLDGAEKALLEALRRDPRESDAAIQMTAVLEMQFQEGRPRDRGRLVDYYERALALREPEPELAGQYGRLLRDMGAVSRARSMLHEAVEGGAREFRNDLTELNQTAEQVAVLEQEAMARLRRNPNDAQGLRYLAQVQTLSGRHLDALYLANGLLAQGVRDIQTWLIAGLAEGVLGAAESFVERWPEPPSSRTGTPDPWVQAATLCAANDAWNAAQTYLESAVAANPELEPSTIMLGEIALQLRDLPRARRVFEQATRDMPEAPKPWLYLSDLALARRDADTARELLGEAEVRGASEEDLAPRYERLSPQPGLPELRPGETIIR